MRSDVILRRTVGTETCPDEVGQLGDGLYIPEHGIFDALVLVLAMRSPYSCLDVPELIL